MCGQGVRTLRTIVITVVVVVCLLALPGLLLGSLMLAGIVEVGEPLPVDIVESPSAATVAPRVKDAVAQRRAADLEIRVTP
jgi:hypothetical protein